MKAFSRLSSRIAIVSVLALPCGAIHAQEMGPRPSSELDPSFFASGAKKAPAISITDATRLRLPAFVAAKEQKASRLNVIGHGRMLEDEGIPLPSLRWVEAADGRRTATVVITSPGAEQLRVGIRIVALPPDAMIQVAPGSGTATPVHEEQLRAAVGSLLWTPPTPGDTQVVQLAAGSGNFIAQVVGVSHIVVGISRAASKSIGDALACQVDVACVSQSPTLDPTIKTAFNNKVNSTAYMEVTDASGRTTTCTGTLLNNDYRAPVFISAQHCVANEGEANSLVTAWGYQATSCGSGIAAPFSVRTGGAIHLAAREDLDQSIMMLREAPPASAILSGWNGGLTFPTGELMMGMHHPRGDLKKTSIGSITGLSGAFSIGTTNYPANSFHLTNWQIGLVEPGSSGSGLFIQPPGSESLSLVGVLNSGPASGLTCTASTTYTTRYGRLNNFIPTAQKFLQNTYSTNFSDLWWNPTESGWGINLQHQGDTVFATWFTYDSDGSGMWLVMSNGERVGTSTFQGTLYRTRGTPFNQINGTPAVEFPLQAVGSATLNFSSANAGTFSYTVNGVSGSKPIQRQVYSTRPTCEFNLANRSSASNYQDLWWNADESGWGVNITHQGEILFATWFTYDSNRAGMWLVMSNGARTGANSWRGELYRTTGTPFNLINGQTSVNLPLPQVGTLSFTFTDGITGTMSYTVNGVQGSKTIRRQLFAYPNTVCRQ